MKRFMMLLMVSITCLGLLATTAEARRLGGGGNFGKQRTVTPQQAPQRTPAATPAPAPQTPAAAPNRNRWLGPLAGLAIGAGLASLFGGGAQGGAIGSILLAVLAAVALMFIISRFAKPKTADTRYAGNAPPYAAGGNPFSMNQQPIPQPAYDLPRDSGVQQPSLGGYSSGNAQGFGTAANDTASANIPHDFPLESFLRGAKASFIRLQAANDRKDLDDIREYTTPEMFAEISLQLMERSNGIQQTDVISLDAQLLEVASEGDLAIAVVRYTGQLAENKGTPEYVDEIWNVQRDTRNPKAGWLLAGIQQTPLQ